MIAIYARQSVDKKDSISIENQIDKCRLEIGDAKYSTYVDRGYSGKNTDRPDFSRMMLDIKRGSISKVVVYRIDRISRAILDFGKIIDTFKTNNVEFCSHTEKFDTSTPIGIAMLNIIMVFAQLERETIQQRITDNYYARREQGFFMGGYVPYGFDRKPIYISGKKSTMLVPREDQAPVVVEMYNLYAFEDFSLGKISDYLNQKKIPAPKGGHWDSGKLSRIMSNPIYVQADADIYVYYKNKGCILTDNPNDFNGINGCFVYGKRDANTRKFTNLQGQTVSLGPHKGLVDAMTFLKCQHKLDANKQLKNTGRSKYTWLSGLLKCKNCGASVKIGAVYKDNVYLACTGHQVRKDCKGLGGTVKVKDVEMVIENQIFSLLKTKKTVFKQAVVRNDKKINECKIHLLKIEEEIYELIDKVSGCSATMFEYLDKRINELDAKKREYEAILESLKLESDTEDTFHVLTILEQWPNLDLEEKKFITRKIIDHITITSNSLEVYWRRAFDVLQ